MSRPLQDQSKFPDLAGNVWIKYGYKWKKMGSQWNQPDSIGGNWLENGEILAV
jgi:hypothetical protein